MRLRANATIERTLLSDGANVETEVTAVRASSPR